MTKIEWTNRTWNPWWGCSMIALECDNCYAAIFASRGLHAVHAGVAAKGEWTGLITRSGPAVWRGPVAFPRRPPLFPSSLLCFLHPGGPFRQRADVLALV